MLSVTTDKFCMLNLSSSETNMSQVLVEAHHNQKPNLYVGVFIIMLSLIVGLLILFLLILMLWKVSAALKPSAAKVYVIKSRVK